MQRYGNNVIQSNDFDITSLNCFRNYFAFKEKWKIPGTHWEVSCVSRTWADSESETLSSFFVESKQ